MKRLCLIFCLLICSVAALAQTELSVRQLRAMVQPGGSVEITDTLVLSGLCISQPRDPNLGDVVQFYYNNASATNNNRILYVQDEDGSAGVMLVFEHSEGSTHAERYAKVKVNLAGSVLKMSERGALKVEGIANEGVILSQSGVPSDVPVKRKKISEITAEDFHTWVTVEDCEYVFKDGAYINILEQYSQAMSDNKQYNPNGMMDNWQSLLCDSSLQRLYVVLNARVPWRRSGNGVPAGKGEISGVIVESNNRRYGAVNAWQIRPFDESDIAFDKDEKSSSFTTICEWNWNDNANTLKTKEGPIENAGMENTMLPDVGKGELKVEFPAKIYRYMDINNPVLEPSKKVVKGDKGKINKGAMMIKTPVSNWWDWADDCGNAVVIKFSTKKIKAERLFLAFSFSCGANNAVTSRFNPAYWGVEVSTDNVSVSRVDVPDIQVKALPWWKNELDGVFYFTSKEAGMGMTEHLVELPASLIGQETVYVRICPVRKALTTLSMDGSCNYALRQNFTTQSHVSFGAITVRYK